MKKIQIIQPGHHHNGSPLAPGTEHELEEHLADWLVARGTARLAGVPWPAAESGQYAPPLPGHDT